FVAALQVLAVVKKAGRPVSDVCHRFPPVPQVMKSVRYVGRQPRDNADLQAAITHATERLGRPGRLGTRPSGIVPVIRVMAEGDDRELVEELVDEIVAALSQVAAAA